ncbi:hypothetical protein [Magnetospira sp. QH-2]|uniref:hypothetical protein n=1 Tax=Magnetospira sp. (strain QH-2) TaxID=1288970 RepID=UPI0003E81703|nr:hypothetical protein [Magnetospira sp. QH-2]CCQ72928.1 conserved membrane protein of unknown function [Magnetospira sp. QH-2]
MQWLVDLDRATADGTLSMAGADHLKQKAREAMIAHAINLALFAGVLMVIGGTIAFIPDRWALTMLGGFLTLSAAFLLLTAGPMFRLVANATGFIGAALAVGALTFINFEGVDSRIVAGLAIGLPAILAGVAMRRFAPRALSGLGGWLILLGALVHVLGILTTESQLGLGWLALHYAGLVALVCGMMLNVRFVTAIALVPLAMALSSRTFYSHASYGVAIYESTLTIIQMGLFAAMGYLAAKRYPEQIADHARLIANLSLIWANVAFWIGSLWGDVVGYHLWGPRWEFVTEGMELGTDKSEYWQAAVDVFEASAITIPADAFTVVWAIGILAVGIWGAMSAKRGVFNIAVTFGSIHFYTQYFERLESSPESFMIAGIIAIGAAWALWSFNRQPSGQAEV